MPTSAGQVYFCGTGARMRSFSAIVGSALFLVVAPGVVAGLVPWLLTDDYHTPLSVVPGFVAAGSKECGQQKSRINKDPAEFDWKCRLRLTSRGEHSRALMGGERALEMPLYMCSSCSRNKHLFCNTRMQKDIGCGPTHSRSQ